MPPPPSCITISSIPFSQVVTVADFNAGTFGGEANAVWFCFTAPDDAVFGVRGNLERVVDMRTRIYANDGSTILNTTTNSRPLGYEIAAADTNYVRIAKTAGGAIAANFTAEFDTRPFLTALPTDAFFVTDFNFISVAIVFDLAGNVLGYFHLLSGEAGAMLADGGFAIANIGGLKVYDATLNLLATVGGFTTFAPVARGVGHFWIFDSDGTIYTVSADGATTTEIAHIPDSASSFGVSLDETILYYVLEDSPIIRRWNLLTDTAMADLYTADDFDNAGDGDVMGLTVNFTPNGEVLVLNDGSILTWWQDEVNFETNFLHVSAAGALLNRIITTGFLVDHPQLAIEGENYIFAWMQDLAQEEAKFGLLNLTTGLFESPFNIAEFGNLRNGNPGNALYNQAMFGPETSCIMLRLAFFPAPSPSPSPSPSSPSPEAVIGPLVWVHWPRLIHDAITVTPPVVAPPPPPAAPPPGGGPVPPPAVEGAYGPQSTITCPD